MRAGNCQRRLEHSGQDLRRAEWRGGKKAPPRPRAPRSGARQFPGARRSHGRVGVTTAEGEKAIGGASDIEVEGEVLVDGEHVAQVALQRIAGVEPLRPV